MPQEGWFGVTNQPCSSRSTALQDAGIDVCDNGGCGEAKHEPEEQAAELRHRSLGLGAADTIIVGAQ